jgi:hypothetical protein
MVNSDIAITLWTFNFMSPYKDISLIELWVPLLIDYPIDYSIQAINIYPATLYRMYP